jgi:S1-C subfamily serine protease
VAEGTPAERVVQVDILATAPALDLALYRADTPLGAGVTVRSTPPTVGEPVLVVGHPGDLPVRVSYGTLLRTGLRVAKVPALAYDAITDWGSSGSVVVDAEGRAIAIHWAWDDEGRFGGGLLGIPLLEAADRWPALAEALGAERRSVLPP